MEFEDNDKVFTVSKETGKLSFGRVKLAHEKRTKIPSTCCPFHRFQVIWDDYSKNWQWLDEVEENSLVIYDRDFAVGDRVIYGDGQKGTVRRIIETAALLNANTEEVYNDVNIKEVQFISVLYPSAMIELKNWYGEIMSVTKRISGVFEDGKSFFLYIQEPETHFSAAKQKSDGKTKKMSRLAKLRLYPYNDEFQQYFPEQSFQLTNKQRKRCLWINQETKTTKLKSMRRTRKYAKALAKITDVAITNLEIDWIGYLPFAESEDADKHYTPPPHPPKYLHDDCHLKKVQPLKPNELTPLDCKDFINFGYGALFRYSPKKSDVELNLVNWGNQFKSQFLNPSDTLMPAAKPNEDKQTSVTSASQKPKKHGHSIRVKKIMSTRSYEVKLWGELQPGIVMQGHELRPDKRYYKVATFKMGYPFVTKRHVLPDFGNLGIILQKSVPKEDESRGTSVMWIQITPEGIKVVDATKESPYDLSYVVSPCMTKVGSVLYAKENPKFRFGIITQFDILDFGKVHVYDPILGHSLQDISTLISAHSLLTRTRCGIFSSVIFKADSVVNDGRENYVLQNLVNSDLRILNMSTFEIDNLVSNKYSEVETAPLYHCFNSEYHTFGKDDRWEACMKKEIEKFKTELPNGIWICGFKDKKNLFSILIEGKDGTILEDILILFEMKVHQEFPRRSFGRPPFSIFCSNMEGILLTKKATAYCYANNTRNCDTIFHAMKDWNIKWDSETSSLVDVVTIIQAKLAEKLYLGLLEPERAEINFDGIQSEYFIYQHYNFAMAMGLLDSIFCSVLKINSAPWEYFARQHYCKALPKIIQRFEKWITLDKERLLRTNKEELPNFPFLPFSKDFAASVMDRLSFLREVLVNGKVYFEAILSIGEYRKQLRNNVKFLHNDESLRKLYRGFLSYHVGYAEQQKFPDEVYSYMKLLANLCDDK